LGFKAAPQSGHLLKLVYQFSIAACIRLHPLLTAADIAAPNAEKMGWKAPRISAAAVDSSSTPIT
jgi:hypothetical protein